MEEKKRKANRTEDERLAAIELIVHNADKLFRKFRGASLGAKDKERCWENIASELNSSGKTLCRRSVNELKKKYSNSKGKAKEKIDSMHKTGGGPKPSLMSSEEVIVQHLMKNNRAQLEGIIGGIDSESTVAVQAIVDLDVDEFALHDVVCIGENVLSTFLPKTSDDVYRADAEYGATGLGVEVNECQRPSTSKHIKTQTNKRKRDEFEKTLYQLETEKIKKEIEKLEAEIQHIQQTSKQDNELFTLKKELLQNKLKSCKCLRRDEIEADE